jgi:hypothetical protein
LAEKQTPANLFPNLLPMPFGAHAPLRALRSYRVNQLAE